MLTTAANRLVAIAQEIRVLQSERQSIRNAMRGPTVRELMVAMAKEKGLLRAKDVHGPICKSLASAYVHLGKGVKAGWLVRANKGVYALPKENE